MNRIRTLAIWLVTLVGAGAQDDLEDRGGEILKELVSQEWAREWKRATLESVRLVKQKSDLKQATGLPPVWFAEIRGSKKQSGYLMWESSGDGRLVEFSLDAPIKFVGEEVAVVEGVPALQQFAVDGDDGQPIASGCVPTSAASVISFWAAKRFSQWKGADGKTPKQLAERIRARLDMTRFPDEDGFTENGMALAGAMPHKLAAAIRADAKEHQVEIECGISKFSMKKLKREIDASRPALVSCVVRVPHKPELSWGHELAAVGWAEIDGVEMVGVLDNFYPTKYTDAIRWIREDAFSSIITLRPSVASEGGS